MSNETRLDLQRNFLIGNCKNRPRAWHFDAELQRIHNLEPNHYDEPIPYADVVRRLFVEADFGAQGQHGSMQQS